MRRTEQAAHGLQLVGDAVVLGVHGHEHGARAALRPLGPVADERDVSIGRRLAALGLGMGLRRLTTGRQASLAPMQRFLGCVRN